MRAVFSTLLAIVAYAQTPGPAPLVFSGKPLAITAECTEDDMQSLGLACSVEEPCPIYLELSGLDTGANRLLIAGNLHTETATLASILLASEDGGVSWTEAHPRIKHAALDQMFFLDLQNGWISGQIISALPQDPFFLLSNDGGKSWRRRAVFGESGPGTIEQFTFESPTNGSLLVDRSAGAEGGRYAFLESQTGGESWSIRSVTREKVAVKSRPAGNAAWRVQAHSATKSYRVERKEASGRWTPVSSFLVSAGQCKPAATELKEPTPEPTAASDAVEVFQIGTPKNAKKDSPKKKP
jgi:hypothetical protein